MKRAALGALETETTTRNMLVDANMVRTRTDLIQ